MKILAVDTATKSCSVALVDNGVLSAELTVATGETHSKHLMRTIEMVLERSGHVLSDLEGFAVIRGPGSFTGIRIGISTVKGLAMALGKPVVGISSLDALAAQSASPGFLICPFLDARKREVYFSRYRLVDGELQSEVAEQVASPVRALEGIGEACLFVGDGAILYRDVIIDNLGGLAHFVSGSPNIIRACTVGILGQDRLEKGLAADVDTFVPHYIRRSDAELKKKASITFSGNH